MVSHAARHHLVFWPRPQSGSGPRRQNFKHSRNSAL